MCIIYGLVVRVNGEEIFEKYPHLLMPYSCTIAEELGRVCGKGDHGGESQCAD